MIRDVEGRGPSSRPRRPGRILLLAVAVLLLIGGGTAVAVGIADQDPDPAAPSVAAARRTDGAVPGPATTSPAPPPSASETAGTPAPPKPVAAPVSITVPAIDVQSDLVTVGLNPDGTLEVPQPGPDYDKAAWFRDSPRPGEVGPAVIEGHVDSAANGPSVFYELGTLTPGDRVSVDRKDGSAAVFEVYDVRQYPKDEFPTLDVYGNTDGAELRLITCGGNFDATVRSYVDNIVVFASLVENRPA